MTLLDHITPATALNLVASLQFRALTPSERMGFDGASETAMIAEGDTFQVLVSDGRLEVYEMDGEDGGLRAVAFQVTEGD